MRKVHYRAEAGVGRILLDDGKANTIDPGWLTDLEVALTQARRDEVAALLLEGGERIFCAGLDLKLLPTLPRDSLDAFAERYERLMRQLFCLPLPLVADVGGHAVAGGGVLLLCADFAVTDRESKHIGISGARAGIVLPPFVVAMGRARLAPAELTRALAAGALYDPPGVLRAGFIHEVAHSPDERRRRALEEAQRLAALPRTAFSEVKRQIRAPVLEAVPEGGGSTIARFFADASGLDAPA